MDKLGFLSPMFVVPKKGGKWRPVINLRLLSQYVLKPHFKMEDIRTLKDIIQEGDQMAKLDLKDAYFSVPMAQNSKRLLQFQWKSQLLQFTCLPFGLSSASYVLTKLIHPVLISLRDQGIRCLDDMLILGKNSPRTQSQLLSQQIIADDTGLLCKRREILPGPNTGIRISGVPHRLQANDTISDRRETEVSNITMQEAVESSTGPRFDNLLT